MNKTISELQEEAHACATAHGFHERAVRVDNAVNTDRVLAHLALIHSEVSEAVEAARVGNYVIRIEEGKPEGLVVELADTVSRILDTCGALGHGLERAIEVKMAYNSARPYKHGNKLA